MANSEIQGDGRQSNLPGVYKHPETGIKIETSEGSDGYIQGDAFVQVGFKYIGPHGSDEPKTELKITK